MKWVAKFFLWLIGVAVPVFIAACYGMPYRYNKEGKVIDTQTKEGIDGILVSCLRNNTEQSSNYSFGGGKFYVDYNQPCDELKVEDVDGAENGGPYAPRIIPFCQECQTITVELTPQD